MIKTCPHCDRRMKHISSEKDTDVNGREFVRWQTWECSTHGRIGFDRVRNFGSPAAATTEAA